MCVSQNFTYSLFRCTKKPSTVCGFMNLSEKTIALWAAQLSSRILYLSNPLQLLLPKFGNVEITSLFYIAAKISLDQWFQNLGVLD